MSGVSELNGIIESNLFLNSGLKKNLISSSLSNFSLFIPKPNLFFVKFSPPILVVNIKIVFFFEIFLTLFNVSSKSVTCSKTSQKDIKSYLIV